jgi:sugar phosphate isomerase/epimerase
LNIRYICPFWGQEELSSEAFLDKVLENGYGGIEIHLPDNEYFIKDLFSKVEEIRKDDPDFAVILQQLEFPVSADVNQYIELMGKKLRVLAAYQPTLINSHTGRDYYSFEENCSAIEVAMEISQESGVKILHETHRGRFSFHASTLIPYLEKYNGIELTGDFSHFCAVSESLLEDQEEILARIIPHVSYIHARIGHAQGAQVNDPFAPEWGTEMNAFLAWWDQIIRHRMINGEKEALICTEFGPAPYMPAAPFTKEPLADQWKINMRMKEFLQNHYRNI